MKTKTELLNDLAQEMEYDLCGDFANKLRTILALPDDTVSVPNDGEFEITTHVYTDAEITARILWLENRGHDDARRMLRSLLAERQSAQPDTDELGAAYSLGRADEREAAKRGGTL